MKKKNLNPNPYPSHPHQSQGRLGIKQTDPQDTDDAPKWYKRIIEEGAKILAQDEQDRDDARQREASLQQTIADLQAVLFNTAGLERLANITDEEWTRAESEDDEE